jgi:hypothetical protein
VVQDTLAFDKKIDAGLSQRNASGRAVEELSSNAAFEVPDLAAHRRLRDVERLGCSTKMQVFGDRYKIPQVAKFETKIVRSRTGQCL